MLAKRLGTNYATAHTEEALETTKNTFCCSKIDDHTALMTKKTLQVTTPHYLRCRPGWGRNFSTARGDISWP